MFSSEISSPASQKIDALLLLTVSPKHVSLRYRPVQWETIQLLLSPNRHFHDDGGGASPGCASPGCASPSHARVYGIRDWIEP